MGPPIQEDTFYYISDRISRLSAGVFPAYASPSWRQQDKNTQWGLSIELPGKTYGLPDMRDSGQDPSDKIDIE
jgi:hypothetical protein